MPLQVGPTDVGYPQRGGWVQVSGAPPPPVAQVFHSGMQAHPLLPFAGLQLGPSPGPQRGPAPGPQLGPSPGPQLGAIPAPGPQLAPAPPSSPLSMSRICASSGSFHLHRGESFIAERGASLAAVLAERGSFHVSLPMQRPSVGLESHPMASTQRETSMPQMRVEQSSSNMHRDTVYLDSWTVGQALLPPSASMPLRMMNHVDAANAVYDGDAMYMCAATVQKHIPSPTPRVDSRQRDPRQGRFVESISCKQ